MPSQALTLITLLGNFQKPVRESQEGCLWTPAEVMALGKLGRGPLRRMGFRGTEPAYRPQCSPGATSACGAS